MIDCLGKRLAANWGTLGRGCVLLRGHAVQHFALGFADDAVPFVVGVPGCHRVSVVWPGYQFSGLTIERKREGNSRARRGLTGS